VLLTVIAVATLLVAVVGATFAYFTAANSTSGDAAGNVNVNTATEGASLQLNVNKVTGSNNVFYPGTKNFVGATASAQFVDNNAPSDGKNYNISYTLNGSITLGATFATDIKWNLYETTDDLLGAEGGYVVKCDPVTAYTPSTEGATAIEGSKTQVCNVAPSLSGKSVKSGTITAGTTSAAVNYSGTVTTSGSTEGAKKYYYLVVELPETGADQSADATGKTITIAIDKIEQTGSAVAS